MDEGEKLHAHAFNSISLVGQQKLRRVRKYFGSFEKAWHCHDIFEFVRAKIDGKTAKRIINAQSKTSPEELWEDLGQREVICVANDENSYPQALSEIHSPPLILYLRGKLTKADNMAVAIVGTRKATDYGRQVTMQLASELAANEITVVSGLALGIDAAAHEAALDAGGRTLAVLGGSVAKGEVFPRTNARLGERMTKHGALISEYVPGVPPRKENFPVRNRLISGLTLGTIVVEAAARSGALITAFTALDQNREVMAVPGNINATYSEGPNMLIKKGAALIRTVDDIFEVLGINEPKQIQKSRKCLPETENEKVIYKALSSEPTSLDRLVLLTKFDVNVISSTLSIMEVKGIVRQIGIGYIVC
ncbi:DNA-processing protein DprA [Patescibacteria group bacterium]